MLNILEWAYKVIYPKEVARDKQEDISLAPGAILFCWRGSLRAFANMPFEKAKF